MNRRTDNSPPDYLILGHLTKDLLEEGHRLGGTAAFSALTAKRMGADVALFTSGAEDLPLDILEGIQIYHQPALRTTTFYNQYTPAGRKQILSDRADDLDLDLLPESWRRAKVVHLAPVAREIPLSAGNLFPASVLAYSLQGWMRNWDENGLVFPAALPEVSLPERADLAAFLSIEDLNFDRSSLKSIRDRFPILFLTLGDQGAELYQGSSYQSVPPLSVQEIDPTGAGDIFAGAFLVGWVLQGRTKLAAARVASVLAGKSVTREGVASIPEEQEIQAVRKVQE